MDEFEVQYDFQIGGRPGKRKKKRRRPAPKQEETMRLGQRIKQGIKNKIHETIAEHQEMKEIEKNARYQEKKKIAKQRGREKARNPLRFLNNSPEKKGRSVHEAVYGFGRSPRKVRIIEEAPAKPRKKKSPYSLL